MNEDADLKSRVEHAIQKMTANHELRRHNNQSLSHVLALLEQKYNSRGDELRQCHERIAELTAANQELATLLDRVVEVAETRAHDDGDEAIRRATDMARDIVRSWGGDPSADGPPVPARSALHSSVPAMTFEDVSSAELAAELLAEQAGQADGPVEAGEISVVFEAKEFEPVEIIDAIDDVRSTAEGIDAIVVDEIAELETALGTGGATPVAAKIRPAVAAASPPVPEFEEVEVVDDSAVGEIAFEPAAEAAPEIDEIEIDIPEPAPQSSAAPARGGHETTREDIRAMLDRLERAAARAQAFSEQQAKAKTPSLAPRGKERTS